jgi:predicted enzyme related to lactoylglutathione lyase
VSQRDGYEAGVPCWIDTLQPDPEAARNFYGAIFGWEFTDPGSIPGDPPGRYYVARLRGRDIAGIGSHVAKDAPPMRTWYTYVSVDSADRAAEQAQNAGGVVVAGPFDAPPAGRLAVLTDPTGALICVWEPRARQGSQLVNEPGAWTMSMLHTPDLERAAEFYGTLFGWTTETFGSGDNEVTMFRLPGYVGGEPQQPVSREVVATMVKLNGEAHPHWSVDFWVHDVDATAAKTAEHGGAALAPPFETPVGKMAVLADPQGVTYSVSSVPRPR